MQKTVVFIPKSTDFRPQNNAICSTKAMVLRRKRIVIGSLKDMERLSKTAQASNSQQLIFKCGKL